MITEEKHTPEAASVGHITGGHYHRAEMSIFKSESLQPFSHHGSHSSVQANIPGTQKNLRIAAPLISPYNP